MILLSAKDITKIYVERKILDNISFFLNEGDKIGIIGVNGTGKSTFLKILAEKESVDNGEIVKSLGVRVAYLPQNPVFEKNISVLEQVLINVSADIRENKQYEAKSILSKLGIDNFDREIGTLSGGEKRRVAIATALITPCEVLIMDEPTNHIDNDTVLWLENYLQKYKGAIVMVTHDRYFLDRVANRILEIDKGHTYDYNANFSKFIELKAQREEMALGTERKNKSIYRTELEWIKRGVRARGTKSRSRIENFETLKNREIPTESEKLQISSISSRLGKKTIEFKDISKGFNGRTLISHFNQIIPRDARIGIVGKNGCGKSTLLKMINSEVTPDSGEIIIGETVNIGYFSQECEQMDTSMKAIDYIKETAEYIETVDGKLSATQLLEKFVFPPELQWSVIGKLSGGERKRLFLLKILSSSPNILLLDEPTNDLDIQTLEILENYLESFNGAVIAVSHDRYFLDKIADNVWEFMGDGNVNRYIGGYSDYLEKRITPEEINTKDKTTKQIKPKSISTKLKFSFKEQREYENIDNVIAEIEDEIENIASQIQKSATDYVKVGELSSKKEDKEKELEFQMERWVYLNDLAEKIDNQ